LTRIRLAVLAAQSALCVGLAACSGATTMPTSPVSSAAGCSNVSGDPNTSSPPRCVRFAGFDWTLKSSLRFDPGPNAWSDDPANVWVDPQGLHLAITNRGGQWYAAEAILNQSFGYGTYEFELENDPSQLDSNAVLGLFTYNYRDADFAHREIDIEFSPLLGFTPGAAGHFTVQPFTRPGNTHDFAISAPWSGTHSFEWRPDRIVFRSGGETWTYSGPDLPQAGGENVRINLWLFRGRAPSQALEPHVVIKRFAFER
jgi:hypothetical protein